MILNEHEKLSIENPLLKNQIQSLTELNQLYNQSDSLQRKEIELYKDKVDSDEKQIQKLKASKKRILVGSSIGGIVLFIIGLLL